MTPLLDGRRQYSRPNNRFLIFALAAILAIGGLTTRLFYLQIVNGGQFTVLSEGNRTSAEAIPSARGLIYDRRGVALVKNVPTFAVKIRPVDLPEDRRDDVVSRLRAVYPTSSASVTCRARSTAIRAHASISSGSQPTFPTRPLGCSRKPAMPFPASRSSSRLGASTRWGRWCRSSWATRDRCRRTSSRRSGPRDTSPTTCSARPGSRPTTRRSSGGRTGRRPSRRTPPVARSRTSRR